MTSQRGSAAHPAPGFTGHLRIQPALNEAERDHLAGLTRSRGTLRGTPTGRGDGAVPFARLAWDVCPGGCCLTWDPGLESSRMMLPTLQFLIDHLLRHGARAQGHARFGDFTFDHVLDGVVIGRAPGDEQPRVVEVADNAASERLLAAPCGAGGTAPRTRSTGRTRRGRLPANVIELRPRRA